MVIELSGNADFEVSSQSQSLKVTISDCAAGSVVPAYSKLSKIIDRIELTENGNTTEVTITTMEAFELQQSRLDDPVRIVLDLHARFPLPNRKLQLARADFYAESGKLNSADKAYAELSILYPRDAEILYKWGKLLTIREAKPRALKKLSQIPEKSYFYKPAQELIAQLKGEVPLPVQAPKKPEPALEKPPITTPPVKADSTAVKDSLAAAPLVRKPVATRACDQSQGWGAGLTKFVTSNCILLLSILGMALLVLIIIIIRSFRTGRKPRASTAKGMILDDETKRKMVMQLVNDGWRSKEIARELNLGVKEVESIVNLCQTSGMES